MEKKSYRDCSDTEFQEAVDKALSPKLTSSMQYVAFIIVNIVWISVVFRMKPIFELGMITVNSILCVCFILNTKRKNFISFADLFMIFICLADIILFFLCILGKIKRVQAVTPLISLFGIILIIVPRINSLIKKLRCTEKMEVELMDAKIKVANNNSVDANTGEEYDLSFVTDVETVKKISIEGRTCIFNDPKNIHYDLYYFNPDNIYEIYSPKAEKSFCRTMTVLGCVYILLEVIFFLMMKYA